MHQQGSVQHNVTINLQQYISIVQHVVTVLFLVGSQVMVSALRSRSRHSHVLLQDMHQEIQDVLGQNFGIPDDIDEDELMEELDALEDDLTADTEANADGVPSYLQVLPIVSVHVLAVLLSGRCCEYQSYPVTHEFKPLLQFVLT